MAIHIKYSYYTKLLGSAPCVGLLNRSYLGGWYSCHYKELDDR